MRTIRVSTLLAGTALALVLILPGHGANAQTAEVAIPPVGDVQLSTDADIQPNFDAPKAAETKPEADKPATAAAPVAEPAKPAVETATPAKPADSKPVIDASAPKSQDTLVVDRLREMASKLDRSFSRKNERTAVEAFYKDRNYAPLWVSNGALTAKGKAAIDYLKQVDRDGLDPTDYPVPDFKAAGDPESQADAEIKLTAAVMTYARHALHGRIAWSRVASDIFYDNPRISADEVLKRLASSTDMAATLNGFEPQFPEYQKLKKALADARAGKLEEKKPEAKPVAHVHIPEGKILRPGMKDERVVLLRKRLSIGGDSNMYDDAVRDAVRAFQTESDLADDGNLGPNTTRALNGEKATASAPKMGDPADTIIANLDRWRWVPRDLGNTHVIVNIPDYRLTLWNDGKVYWTTKIVVGKPNLATPLITAEMKFITVNPTWNVPPSIIEKEYLPALQEDPQALERIGLKIEQTNDGTIRIWQPPGAGNALGRIRFNFPNKFLVYQHDTPDKHLFAKDRRAYSHGCMRVQNPLTYAEKLLELTLPQERYSEAKLEKMFGGSEININFPTSKHIPVHLTYQTAFVDADGKLQLREDVYGRDQRMIAILKGERKVADIPMERPPNTSAKPVRASPGMYGGGGGYDRGGGPGDFFGWMFGGQPRRYEYGPPPGQRRGDSGRTVYR